MTRDPDYWRRRYERAEQGRLEALDKLAAATRQAINTAADDQQKQIDALEQLVLNRAALTDIVQDGRALRLSFVRRGQIHQIETYNAMGGRVPEWRKALLED